MFRNLNLPNKLTVFRIALVPVFIIVMALASIQELKWLSFVALGVYIIASLTDFIDGKIARSRNLITDFGKVMDPLADKVLVSTGFIMLTFLGIVPGWMVAVIIARDFFIDGLRMLAIMRNKVVPANFIGKIKTFFEMVTIVLLLLNYPMTTKDSSIFAFLTSYNSMAPFALLINILASICMVGTFIVTVVSLITYTISFSRILSSEEDFASANEKYEDVKQIDILEDIEDTKDENQIDIFDSINGNEEEVSKEGIEDKVQEEKCVEETEKVENEVNKEEE
ncbi:MAG: CDP-diacylglycerol--glycerol-3-phosphate 3-phosphatidyltransferase [Clostridia bacterium]|nr:CDP-diacylglycerol--glycerol-3-phosphate 3-phosphatidyltransferase [Clostridia bacterium]